MIVSVIELYLGTELPFTLWHYITEKFEECLFIFLSNIFEKKMAKTIEWNGKKQIEFMIGSTEV